MMLLPEPGFHQCMHPRKPSVLITCCAWRYAAACHTANVGMGSESASSV
eukprot:CAMPEP_0198223394 /NCGR_PEP_ID=MMETSP1445-20131203/92394_1 /TAXON_ID=36898 /ORGANISM="Pyramimonas sp., Strain CCMP2087" /LENGTH=48 /DNA_ID= /DNA_START= /DNA_END= /DNA_ORIENTATION=